MAKTNGKRRRAKTEPTLDDETRRRRAVLAKMEKATTEELMQVAIRAGILTADLELAAPYRDDAPPSRCRPSD